jgi:endonuclease-8
VPEGDTIHRAARELDALVGDALSVEAIHPRARATRVAERVDGHRLVAVEAHGKNLLLRFDGGAVLRSHLGMTGSWRVVPADAEIRGSPWLVLRGGRHVGVLRGGARLELRADSTRGLGPDVLAGRPDLARMIVSVRSADPRQSVGDVLLDQALVSGIGNIWRSEALHAACVSPWLPIGEVTDDELVTTLTEAARLMASRLRDDELVTTLTEAARLMGLSAAGRRPRLQVYRRAGRPCRRCGETIRAARGGERGRVAYWCPGCQRGNGAGGT